MYTAILGGTDTLQEPAFIDDGIRYICFIDSGAPEIQSSWEFVNLPTLPLDPRRTARALKLLPHRLFPSTSRSVWIDGSCKVIGDTRCLFTAAPLSVFRHPDRVCAYEEATVCIQRVKDDARTIKAQMEAYRTSGFPKNQGLISSGVLVRRHTHQSVIALMEHWWAEICAGSVRDQLSFNYVAWKLGFKPQFLPGGIFANPYFSWRPHNRVVVYDAKGRPSIPLKARLLHNYLRLRRRLGSSRS